MRSLFEFSKKFARLDVALKIREVSMKNEHQLETLKMEFEAKRAAFLEWEKQNHIDLKRMEYKAHGKSKGVVGLKNSLELHLQNADAQKSKIAQTKLDELEKSLQNELAGIQTIKSSPEYISLQESEREYLSLQKTIGLTDLLEQYSRPDKQLHADIGLVFENTCKYFVHQELLSLQTKFPEKGKLKLFHSVRFESLPLPPGVCGEFDFLIGQVHENNHIEIVKLFEMKSFHTDVFLDVVKKSTAMSFWTNPSAFTSRAVFRQDDIDWIFTSKSFQNLADDKIFENLIYMTRLADPKPESSGLFMTMICRCFGDFESESFFQTAVKFMHEKLELPLNFREEREQQGQYVRRYLAKNGIVLLHCPFDFSAFGIEL